ncbi:5-methyltetrahydropteroyltriglutamate--homocysteine S-methyltransferase [Cellulomonas hominis]|uniref:5-methyltetrahydropteroyltriglutamate--homocysteine methyltransferase n=1 Tax=Cellulomonas hominis TaxID=156981 RepID=A0A511FBJ8_9CELL|nr:5-methyltetrahydropteroyltriglutamate--homocysteine S-methyltransferase [Cellulomonas hominis]MBB5472791.1 5-methyltetrahydropteroyltriglutamate--homocysteine methyltransferase [Cellulomonas hominis]MBU5422246.1 5-methyltetrahydropteroyltriglutamate--homocysteine S-methyltransferase [Cellulomonas hominis]NKY06031.1 5-methyltetrahydropteroyltriglutamate--homocysteine S-methyltransferase [Cellulomonas hominis]GEL46563.1 5-methyltetrahydropteroyltriglutamate--homocysteine methyltransferase [Cel
MTDLTHPFPSGTVLGYPRIGPRRELKKAVEAFWAGRSTAEEVEATAAELRRRTRARLAELGLDTRLPAIPSAFSFYDHVLDAATVLGAVPERFADLATADGGLDLAGYSTVARGRGDDLPLEMTKWFDSNYHYLVPEIGPATAFRYASDRPVREFAEGLADGVLTRPVLVGPVTFLALAKAAEGSPADFLPIDRLADVLPVYAELLRDLARAGATWVQLDEPALVSDSTGVPADRLLAAAAEAYRALAADLPTAERPSILVAAPYGDLRDALPVLAASDVEGLAIDLVRGSAPASPVPGLASKVLVGGVVDGHNIWRADLDAALGSLEHLESLGAAQVAVSSSTSLFHLPHDVEDEPELDPTLRSWLAFADQKIGEVVTLATGLTEGREAVHAELLAAADARRSRAEAPGVVRPDVRERLAALPEGAFHRGDFAERRAAQTSRLRLPALPTTTIGSFPQTPEIRAARTAFGRGELTAAQYEDAMKAEIRQVVELQEQIGLDVLVHGEPERNDMVQYFAENLDGFAVTQNGWVQSYGSRCTRPSILWGDVARPAPITVPWTTYTQSLTPKPVKGMLTGPVTILAWSFVRDDQPLGDTANQVALALRDEVADLEAAGTAIVQVDEPALRELLPLRAEDHAAYLEWSVRSFRLATSGVRPDTQIHTHLCYSEFGEVIGAIDGLDADVTSIEAARSKMEILADIAAEGYPRGIGPGVYDIHSPRVPSEAEVTELLTEAVRAIDPEQLWVNPDCGLKTRRYAEVTPSLEHVLAATRTVRASLAVPTA